jgi:hypothetical protein
VLLPAEDEADAEEKRETRIGTLNARCICQKYVEKRSLVTSLASGRTGPSGYGVGHN